MMNINEKNKNSIGRNSTLYISNFVMFGILFVGVPILVISFIVVFPLIEGTLIGIMLGSLLGYIMGTLLDVKAELKFREEMRKKAQVSVKVQE